MGFRYATSLLHPQPSMAASTLANTLGATEIGIMISSLLYGVTCVQVYLYIATPKQRPTLVITTVALVTILETVHLISMWMYFFHISVSNFGNPLAFTLVTWRFGILLGSHSILVLLVQLFFCYRIWILSHRLWLVLPPALACFARACITFTLSILAVTVGIAIFHEKSHAPVVYTTIILSAGADSFITACLCSLLWRRKTGYQSTVKIINGIVYWTLETGALTTVTAVLILVLFMATPNAAYWNALLMIYPRRMFYANSLLISLGTMRDRETPKSSRGPTSLADSGQFAHPSVSGGAPATQSFNVEMPEYPRIGSPHVQSHGSDDKMANSTDDAFANIPTRLYSDAVSQKMRGAATLYGPRPAF